MAKSLRSKTKRTFRRIKREDSAFSVAHAARLERLNSKLSIIKALPKPQVEEEGQEESGWYHFSLFGLVDPDSIQVDTKGSPFWLQAIESAMQEGLMR